MLAITIQELLIGSITPRGIDKIATAPPVLAKIEAVQALLTPTGMNGGI